MSKGRLRWDCAHEQYACTDGIKIFCRFKKANALVPKNGLWLRRDGPQVLVVSGIQMNRDVTSVIGGESAKTYALPSTVTVVSERSFEN